ncbi:tRNA (adenosine(37)-N6)-threonylcarbamoyltransferase complex dimerization subunit type 1 TsaB [Curvibacter sp. CHRR-16]|uniref:tRNA (adenosine(37)-N6)-threonylcarbamoyltransferase complex dimerization subunit type 1 TsaB n=1 Tax=Curvibacter sp. CHRR-16 TaxID=2835872 RepID=UPI001BDB4DEA|nr:tRNA (adenosine(37)-N6)-threonylcarbamoyltransferase complex dimerization subunit type 1 TsaB [Curvibacter sp. CHRR-16]MBT0570032.1 tRNA (adenosine(37)-N6)-threonylcarbamoyltransferase complex dimerization subunit type 1 TsaB [Curvibacter sp. CHRR-16]
MHRNSAPSAAWLALDTGTEQLSVAVCNAAGTVHAYQGAGAAQSSVDLIPAVQRLMGDAGLVWTQLQGIAFGMGPGSFTGLRTACSVAQGLALGAGLSVLPVDSLLAVAEDARQQAAPDLHELEVWSLLDARMDEMYAARYRYAQGRWSVLQPSRLMRPAQWLEAEASSAASTVPLLLAGNVWTVYSAQLPVEALPQGSVVQAMPTATAMLRLAPALWAQGLAVPPEDALPLYVRDKVAQTTAERAAAKAAQALVGDVA